MAKSLATPPPSSSVVRLLDLSAAARAVAINTAPSEPMAKRVDVSPELTEAEAPIQPVPPVPEKAHVKREVVLTAETDAVFSRLVELYRRSTGTKLTASHVARAMLKGADHCMHHLEREARRIGPTRLPSNARGRELERARFEARLADAFIAGIRFAPALERES